MSIAKAYNSWSEIYDTNRNKTRDLDQKVTQEVLSKYRFEEVLELGCGTGKNTEWFASKASKVTALDFSDGMLAQAKQKITAAHVHFHQADLTHNWQVEDQAFDLASCNLVLEHIENLVPIFAQAHQKLKVGGKFFVCELHPFKQYAGTKARYETESGVEELEVYMHHFSEYLHTAQQHGFTLIDAQEWFDGDDRSTLPRLISFVFEK
ncbi:MAG: class I SAM-dependent DNA methyltransferase [Flammeovirgaceae bacterium]